MSAFQSSRTNAMVSLLACAVAFAWSAPVDARGGRGGGGGGMGARASAHGSINGGGMNRGGGDFDRGGAGNIDRNGNGDRNTNISGNTNIDRNTNINSVNNVNVNVDNDHWNDWDDHPIAAAAVVTTGVAITAAAIGSIAYSVPPSCVTTVVNGIAYQQCGSTWYQPQYAGSNVQYIVVAAP